MQLAPYTVRTFIYSHAAGLGALYGHLILHTQLAPYTVRTFIYSHAAVLGALYGPLIFHTQLVPFTVRTFIYSHAAGIGALYDRECISGSYKFQPPPMSLTVDGL